MSTDTKSVRDTPVYLRFIVVFVPFALLLLLGMLQLRSPAFATACLPWMCTHIAISPFAIRMLLSHRIAAPLYLIILLTGTNEQVFKPTGPRCLSCLSSSRGVWARTTSTSGEISHTYMACIIGRQWLAAARAAPASHECR